MMMTSSAALLWGAIALALACLAQGVSLWRSTRSRWRTVAAIALNVLFAIALWLFLWPPQTTQAQSEVLLLTGSSTDADRARARRARRAVALGDVELSAADQRHIARLADLGGVEALFGDVATLRVLGAGVAPDEWPDVRPWRVAFSAPPIPGGVRTANWPSELETGALLNVTGALTRNTPRDASIHLLDPAGDVVDTALADEQLRFRLTGTTRSIGSFVYRLRVETASGDTVEQVTLPVTVQKPTSMRLLLLWSAPSFESRYVTNWAKTAGANVAARTDVSLERYREEFVRTERQSLSVITPRLLAGFDAVLIDARSWSSLGAPERNALMQATRQNGLGVLLVLRQFADLDSPQTDFPTVSSAAGGATSLALDLTATVSRVDGALINAQNPLIESGSGEALAAYRNAGAGRLGITLVADSHTLVTTGNAATHARYWKTLLDGIAPGDPELTMSVQPKQPRIDKRSQLCFRGENLPPLVTVHNSDEPEQSVALAAHALRPGERCGYWWATRAGWHRVDVGDASKNVFVYAETDWRVAQDAASITATMLARQGAATPNGQTTLTPKAWPRTPFAMVALLIIGGLWWEQKRRG